MRTIFSREAGETYHNAFVLDLGGNVVTMLAPFARLIIGGIRIGLIVGWWTVGV